MVDSPREEEYLQEMGAVYRYLFLRVLSVVGNRHDTDDVMQEVCALLWERFDEFEAGTSFSSWATAFAMNIAKAHVRTRRRRQGYGLSDSLIQRVAALGNAGAELFEVRREVLHRCLEKLKEKDRRFVMSCYGWEATLIELARALRVPVSRVYTRLKRIRRRLVDCVQRDTGTEEDMFLH